MRDLITFIVVLIASGMAMFLGFFLYLRPADAIDAQKRFYARINWRIEPVDFGKEMRNTRMMGMSLLALVGAAIAVYLLLG